VNVNGVWRYVYRAIDEHGQVIDMLLSSRRDAAATRRLSTLALRTHRWGVDPGAVHVRQEPAEGSEHPRVDRPPGNNRSDSRHRITFRVRGTKF
jgi:transposase-like protein